MLPLLYIIFALLLLMLFLHKVVLSLTVCSIVVIAAATIQSIIYIHSIDIVTGAGDSSNNVVVATDVGSPFVALEL